MASVDGLTMCVDPTDNYRVRPEPRTLERDPELWSGCISGALQERGFFGAFAAAGFYAIEILKRDAVRAARETMGLKYDLTARAEGGACGGNGRCC